MPHSRFFVDISLSNIKEITISGDELHHLLVMKKDKDDVIEIINGKNQIASAKIINISNKNALIEIIEVKNKIESKHKLILAQSLLRPNKIDLILEKGTELGVDEFILFTAEYSEIDTVSENRRKRFQSILISAIKQCGRLDLPKLTIIDDITRLKTVDNNYIYGEAICDNVIDISSFKNIKLPICFITGPEKGFSIDEKSFLENKLKAAPIKININILRTETASIAATAILSQIKLSQIKLSQIKDY